MATATQATKGQKWHERYPELGTGPIPIEPYISREYFAKEQEKIFRKVWLNIGRVEQIPNPGDYFVKDLAVCNTSILIVRGKDGVIRAFHNMCSHRGNQLVWNRQGSCQVFTCKFHGWAYGLDGSLRHITDEANFFGLKKEALGITPIAVATWEGFIFINVDPQPTQTLAEYLGEDLRSSLQGYPFDSVSVTCFGWNTDLQANWKVIKDAFQEVYHVSTLHQRALASVFAGKTNPYSHPLNFTLYPRHGWWSLSVDPTRHPTPVEALTQGAGWMEITPADAAAQMPRGTTPVHDPRAAVVGPTLFPNCLVYVSPGSYLTHTFWPLAVDRTRWEVRMYFPQATTLAQRFSQEYNKIFFRDTLMEDVSTVERTQVMLVSGAKKEIVLQDNELLIRYHHRVSEEYLNV